MAPVPPLGLRPSPSVIMVGGGMLIAIGAIILLQGRSGPLTGDRLAWAGVFFMAGLIQMSFAVRRIRKQILEA